MKTIQCSLVSNKTYGNLNVIATGGAPEINKFTGNRYAQGFNGCINIVEGTNTHAVNIYNDAINGYNVQRCSG